MNKIDVLEEKIRQGKSLEDMIKTLDPSYKYYSDLKLFHTTSPPQGRHGLNMDIFLVLNSDFK